MGMAKTAITSSAGKRMVNSLKKQALESGANILGDVVEGKNVGESLNEEFSSAVRKTAGKAIKGLSKTGKRKRPPKKISGNFPIKKKKKSQKRDVIF